MYIYKVYILKTYNIAPLTGTNQKVITRYDSNILIGRGIENKILVHPK